MSWESSGMVGFDLGPLLQGQTRIAELLITRLLLILDVWDGKPMYRKSWAGSLLAWWIPSGMVGFDLGPLLQGQTRIAELKSAYNSLIIDPRRLGW